jgi:hypothetical protein
MEFKEIAVESGITGWERVPAFDCDPLFISALSDIIIDSLPILWSVKTKDLVDQIIDEAPKLK